MVVAAGATQLSSPNGSAAIVGGTGAYAGASGSVTAGRPIGDDSVDILHLAG
jgi:hypothetical protein